ncbi:MAG: antitoxin VbhA family protein [Propionibacteriaceae bacterium]|nr:antitoxin VbhA family protein [Propionibacteriaceae bacterium]
MISDVATRERMTAAAEGSVRAEGLQPSAAVKQLVLEVARGTRSAAEVRRSLIEKHTVKQTVL